MFFAICFKGRVDGRSSVLSNEELSLSLMSKLDALKLDIHEIKTSQQRLIPPSQESRQGNTETQNLAAVVTAASQVVSSAAEIVHQRSEGSKVDVPGHMSELTDDKRKRLAQWLVDAAIPEEQESPPFSPSTATASSAVSDIFDRQRQSTLNTDITTPTLYNPKTQYFPIDQVAEPDELDEEEGETATGLSPISSSPRLENRLRIDTGVDTKDISTVCVIPIEPDTSIEGDDSDGEDKDMLMKEWQEIGLMKYDEGEYAECEQYLEKASQRCRALYPTDLPRQEIILETLSAAIAHQGKCRQVEEILDNTPSTTTWKYRITEIMITVSLEEGKSNQANSLFDRYGNELLGRSSILEHLISLCIKNGMWSVAVKIAGRYRFPSRDTALETCITLTRQRSNWEYAALFLQELLAGKLESGGETSDVYHALAEVQVEMKDYSKARESAQKAVKGRIKLGTETKKAQEAIYLLAKLAFEIFGPANRVEYDSAIKLLKLSTRG